MITKISTYKLYKEYKNSLRKLDEGLIMTHDPFTSMDILGRHCYGISKENKIEYEKNKIKLNIENKLSNDEYFLLINIITNLGYFPSKIEGSSKIKDLYPLNFSYDKDDFEQEIINKGIISNVIKYTFFLEAKYDISVKNANIIYHVTKEDKVKKILKQGLVPKSYNFSGWHPERIYFSLTLIGSETYIQSKKNKIFRKNGDKKEYKDDIIYSILEINVTNKDIKFYKDPNGDYAVYTYDNIHPELIKEIKEC